jgi:hypothetical protein
MNLKHDLFVFSGKVYKFLFAFFIGALRLERFETEFLVRLFIGRIEILHIDCSIVMKKWK